MLIYNPLNFKWKHNNFIKLSYNKQILASYEARTRLTI